MSTKIKWIFGLVFIIAVSTAMEDQEYSNEGLLKRLLELIERNDKRALTASQITKFVSLHNTARATVNPPALTPLPNMVWDTALESKALAWASKCVYAHSNDQTVGENLFLGSTRPDDQAVADSVNAWVAEKAYYNFTQNICQTGKVCGHYTQVVWAKSLKVGCSLVTCPTVTNASGFVNAKFVVCNYSPPGNMYELPRPYEKC